MESMAKTYNTRQKRKVSEPTPKSKVDWKRTKVDTITHILDSEEYTSTSEEEEEDQDESSSTSEEEEQKEPSGCRADEGEDTIRKPRRTKRSMTIESSDSSSDSDGPGVRVPGRRRRAIDEDDEADEEDKAATKKQRRKENLKKLVEKRRSLKPRAARESDEADSSSENVLQNLHESGEDEDSGDLEDFIVQDEEEDANGNQLIRYQDLFRRHKIPQFARNDLHTHLQKVVKAFLINIADNTFLESLYDGKRKKRYAQDMLKSLNYLDDRILAPRLEKLIASCRWKPRYKERVNSYPKLHIRHVKAEEQACDACELVRYCSYVVTLSGQAYDGETLENDDFLPEDKQWLVVGATCARRTEIYHQGKHYKYHLYKRCIPFIQKSKKHSVKENVQLALSKMEEKQFILMEVDALGGFVDEAETFQDEKEESLIA